MPLGKLLRTLVFSLAIAAPLAMLPSGCGDGGGGTDAETSLPPEDDPTLTEDDSTMIDDAE